MHAATPANPGNGIITAGGGAVYSFDPHAPNATSTLRLEGWGFRNDYGLGFDLFHPDLLFVSNNGVDERGSRPIFDDWDDMFIIHLGQGVPFFGWPDHFHDPVTRQPRPVTDSFFCPPSPPYGMCPQFAFSDSFLSKLTVRPAFAELENHSSSNMFGFSPNADFGFMGDIFIAETGAIPPGTSATSLIEFKVPRIDRNAGTVSDFIAHTSNDMATVFAPTGMNKPIDVKFRGQYVYRGFWCICPRTAHAGNRQDLDSFSFMTERDDH